MSVEINDQKLIDIVYVDDEGNKHKYSGPFINDLTITSEIQEKLTALDTLNTQIGELKTKLSTLNTTVTTTGSKIKYVTELPNEPEEDTCYVLPPKNAPIIQIMRSTSECGWVDYNTITKLAKDSIIYLNLDMGEDPTAYRLQGTGNNWNTTNLPNVYYVNLGPSCIYENGSLKNMDQPINATDTVIMKTMDNNENLIWRGYIKLGFKPEE